MLKTLWSKKLYALAIFLLGVWLSIWLVPRMGSQYVAHALILVNGVEKQSQPLALTQQETLQSRSLAARVIQKTELVNDVEFAPKASKLGAAVTVPIETQSNTFKICP